jgi:O2-independent ubiquinone biosynthesis accessory factor UbiT
MPAQTSVSGIKQKLLSEAPKFILSPFLAAPFPFHKAALTFVLKKLFEESISEGDLDILQNRWLKIHISDLNVGWLFSLSSNQRLRVKAHGVSDVSISGDLSSFILLAAKKEDPDTLFFQRKLVIEGDTELGLGIKNLMDSLDLSHLPPEPQWLLRSAAEYSVLFPVVK